jgi:hypothetical protein
VHRLQNTFFGCAHCLGEAITPIFRVRDLGTTSAASNFEQARKMAPSTRNDHSLREKKSNQLGLRIRDSLTLGN